MCRSIKTLRNPEEPVAPEEVRAAALQFVRKISGYRRPSAANHQVFEAAVDEITQASQRLLSGLVGRSNRTAGDPPDASLSNPAAN